MGVKATPSMSVRLIFRMMKKGSRKKISSQT
jgi:hypothetical protein